MLPDSAGCQDNDDLDDDGEWTRDVASDCRSGAQTEGERNELLQMCSCPTRRTLPNRYFLVLLEGGMGDAQGGGPNFEFFSAAPN